ncbi:carboxypeptidase-like regulatory domain-containing protein [Flaviaesturariibacter amylovorans]|uniref:Carboxypeptidase regulatory-like domain-containing protein n=1 Tax=Flaviaesturariibacter amylovorans TaxID=1084520 RepID=A0ABP8HS23_9BACT
MKFKALLLAALMAGASGAAHANNGNPPGVGEENIKKADVAGGVQHHENRKPLVNVTVTAYVLNRKEKVATTDAAGNYTFDDLKPGTYKFVFEKPGYRKVERTKTIARADEAAELNVLMEEHSTYDFTPGPAHFFDFQ